MVDVSNSLQPGRRVAVVQQIPQRDDVWTNRVEGEVVRVEQRKTGSWFAHSRDDKLWLDRVVLRKDDDEIVVVNLDHYSHIEPVEGSVKPSAAEPAATDAAGATPHPADDSRPADA